MKKKVLFVIESLEGGGAEKILTNIVQNLNYDKYEITVLTVTKTGIYVKDVEKCCRIISMLPDYQLLKNPLAKLNYKKRYKEIYTKPIEHIYIKYIKEKYDVEIAFVEGFATKLVGSSSNKQSKKYAWLHTDMILNSHADQNYKNKREQIEVYHKFDKIFAVSESVRDAFIKKFDSNYPITVQYNPVDSNEIKKMAMERKVISMDSEYNFITIGRLTKEKGYERLLHIAKRLQKDGYKFKIFILGDGELKNDLENYIAQNNLSDTVFLLGFQKNPYPYIRKADFFVCSSITEGFSTAATEALILHRPIITTDCSGMRELFGMYHCGLITKNSENDLYIGIKRFLNKEIDLENLKLDIEKRANKFDITIRMKEIERILDV